jgi:Flp pilus assembly protein TadB
MDGEVYLGRIGVRETYGRLLRKDFMTAEEEISKVKVELDQAQHALQDTLIEASAKAEYQVGALRPDRLIMTYPIGASCLAGALGFVVGSKARSSVLGPAVIAALLGYAISRSPSKDRSTGDGRDTE